ncbi:MAG: type II toxin-antitoxin system HicB family antitoxin [Myxococcaceae bacterium]
MSNLEIQVEQESDGRWLAEATQLPGVMVYGLTRELAIQNVEVLALRVIADRIEHGETVPVRGGFTVHPATGT